MSWLATWDPDRGYGDVQPIDDLRPHAMGDERCWCRPTWDDNCLVHNSADRREEFERGRKVS